MTFTCHVSFFKELGKAMEVDAFRIFTEKVSILRWQELSIGLVLLNKCVL